MSRKFRLGFLGAAVILAGCTNVLVPGTSHESPSLSRVVAVNPVFTDQFNRANSATLGNGWIEKNSEAFSIVNSMVSKAQTLDYRENLAYRPLSEGLQDVQASIEFTDIYDNPYAPGFPQLWIRVQNNTVATPSNLDGYMVYIPNQPGTAIIGRQHGNVEVITVSTITLSQPIAPQGRYRLTISAIGSNPSVSLEANVEQFNGSAWQSIGSGSFVDTAANRIPDAGTVGFSGSTEGGRYTYDNFTYGTATGSGGGGNVPPTANFTFGTSGLTASFTSTSSDSDGSISSYAWSFGDGVTATVPNPTHTYGAAGTYTVQLAVTDNGGASASTSRTVTVNAANQAPTANFTFGTSGLTANFTSTSSDPDGTIVGYSWSFGDGATSTAQNPSHTYGAGGAYTVTLRATDNAGASATTSRTVSVTAPNQAPVVNAGSDQTVVLGVLYSLSASFSDANGNGPWAYTIDWGDGTSSSGNASSQGTISAGHTYLALLTSRTITVRVTDAAGATGSDSKVVRLVL